MVIAGSICANAIQMGVETEYHDLAIYVYLENFFTAVSTWGMCSKQFVERCNYFRYGWNCFDFVLVWMSILDCRIVALITGTFFLRRYSLHFSERDGSPCSPFSSLFIAWGGSPREVLGSWWQERAVTYVIAVR